MIYSETCSCTASIHIDTGVRAGRDVDMSVATRVKDWRSKHKHEVAPNLVARMPAVPLPATKKKDHHA